VYLFVIEQEQAEMDQATTFAAIIATKTNPTAAKSNKATTTIDTP
jgi:hypothetical protein